MSEFHETVFLGGGISCLAAARTFRGDSLLLEAGDRVGGLCRSSVQGGYTFDQTGHLLHLRHPRIRRLVRRLLPGQLLEQTRSAWIHSHGVYTRYPFQSHFYGLPPEVAAECLLGVFAAQSRPASKRPPANFAAWVLAAFGPGVARHFMFPYNQKLWRLPPEELSTGWLGRFVPRPDLGQVVLGALQDVDDAQGYNASFLYPAQGGIETLVRALAKGVKRLRTGARVVRLDLGKRILWLEDGEAIRFGRLVSCAPLPQLVDMIQDAPPSVREAAKRLRWNAVYNLNLGLRGQAPNRHWIYVPAPSLRMYRLGYASNFAGSMAPAGHYGLYTEVSLPGDRTLRGETLRRRVLNDLVRMGILTGPSQVIALQEFFLPFGYVVYDRFRDRAVRTIQQWLARREIASIGRYGRWEYSSMEDALLQGMEWTDNVQESESG